MLRSDGMPGAMVTYSITAPEAGQVPKAFGVVEDL